MNFDDNALYRHKDLLALRDFYEEEPLEIEASRNSINYIRLDGNIGSAPLKLPWDLLRL